MPPSLGVVRYHPGSGQCNLQRPLRRCPRLEVHLTTSSSAVAPGAFADPSTAGGRSGFAWCIPVLISVFMLACTGSAPPLERGDAPTRLDSLEIVHRAEDTFWGDRPRSYQLEVVGYEQDSSGVMVTLYPTDLNLRGGGGIVRVNRDGSAKVLQRFQ
jgi:hypothetical protein